MPQVYAACVLLSHTHIVSCGAEVTRVCSSCQRTLCRNHADCFCFESEAKRDEEKALRNKLFLPLLTGPRPVMSTSLSPLSPCFIPTLSSEPISSSCFPALEGGSSLLRISSLQSPRMVTACQSPPTGRGGEGVRKKQKMGRSTARKTCHDAHSPSFLRQTFGQEENHKSAPASSSFSAKAQPGKTFGRNRRVSLGDGSPLSSSSSSTLL